MKSLQGNVEIQLSQKGCSLRLEFEFESQADADLAASNLSEQIDRSEIHFRLGPKKAEQ